MSRRRKNVQLPVIGWREDVRLPDLEIDAIKVKIDTGARTSAIHAFDVAVELHRGAKCVTFEVHPEQRTARGTVSVEADVVDERWITSSTGHRQMRYVVLMDVELAGVRWTSEVTLARRDQMGFRMLLGREALRDRFLVDPSASFLGRRTIRTAAPARRTPTP